MRAVITVDVPDDFLAERVAEFNEQQLGGEPDTPESYFRGRIADVCDDELVLALFSWPAHIEFTVTATE